MTKREIKFRHYDEEMKLHEEKLDLKGTLYGDFDKTIKKTSIYKSIRIIEVKDGTAYYETEPYDAAYKTSDKEFEETCQKIKRAFERYYKRIFNKYDVNNISVEIYDENSCVAGLSVLNDGTIITSNF